MNTEKMYCVNGHGELQLWEGVPRCWTCGYVPEGCEALSSDQDEVLLSPEQKWEAEVENRIFNLGLLLEAMPYSLQMYEMSEESNSSAGASSFNIAEIIYSQYDFPSPDVYKIRSALIELAEWWLKCVEGLRDPQYKSNLTSEDIWDLVSFRVKELPSLASSLRLGIWHKLPEQMLACCGCNFVIPFSMKIFPCNTDVLHIMVCNLDPFFVEIFI